MRLLLDTHALLWMLDPEGGLSPRARKAITTEGNEVYVSAASLWEASIKVSIGKLKLHGSLQEDVAAHLQAEFLTWLPIELRHIRRVATLPFHHRDPFDRMLVAQALEDGLTLLSADAALDAYSASRVW